MPPCSWGIAPRQAGQRAWSRHTDPKLKLSFRWDAARPTQKPARPRKHAVQAMNDPTATLDRLVGRAEQLYSLPAVAMEVLQLTDNPQVDTRALKECIENDPALTGKILRVVNSSLFGLSREVSDLNQALALLGTKPLKLLVLGFSLPSGLYAGIEARTLGRYWRRTADQGGGRPRIGRTPLARPRRRRLHCRPVARRGHLVVGATTGPALRAVPRPRAGSRPGPGRPGGRGDGLYPYRAVGKIIGPLAPAPEPRRGGRRRSATARPMARAGRSAPAAEFSTLPS